MVCIIPNVEDKIVYINDKFNFDDLDRQCKNRSQKNDNVVFG